MNEFINTEHYRHFFLSRLNTLETLLSLARAQDSISEKELLESRIIADMHPLATQITFTCNQPVNYCQMLKNQTMQDLSTSVDTFDCALSVISDTRQLLNEIVAQSSFDQKAAVTKTLNQGMDLTLEAQRFIDDFLMPNFYFHLVTAYNILRSKGIKLGKRDYMQHLLA